MAKHPVKSSHMGRYQPQRTYSNLHFQSVMNASLYIEILDQTLVPFLREGYPDGHRFMQDNGSKHTSKKAQVFLESAGINW